MLATFDSRSLGSTLFLALSRNTATKEHTLQEFRFRVELTRSSSISPISVLSEAQICIVVAGSNNSAEFHELWYC